MPMWLILICLNVLKIISIELDVLLEQVAKALRLTLYPLKTIENGLRFAVYLIPKNLRDRGIQVEDLSVLEAEAEAALVVIEIRVQAGSKIVEVISVEVDNETSMDEAVSQEMNTEEAKANPETTMADLANKEADTVAAHLEALIEVKINALRNQDIVKVLDLLIGLLSNDQKMEMDNLDPFLITVGKASLKAVHRQGGLLMEDDLQVHFQDVQLRHRLHHIKSLNFLSARV